MRRGYFTPPVLIILAIIIFAVAILIAINTDLVKRIKKEPSSTPAPFPSSASQQSDSMSDETANWKTYTNINAGYSLNFPNGWGQEMCPSSFGDPNDSAIYICSEESFGEVEPVFYYIWIDSNQSLPKINEARYHQETINNLTVYRTKDLPSGSGAESVFFKGNESSYVEIGFTPYDENNPFQDQDRFYKTFGQILSTFQFID